MVDQLLGGLFGTQDDEDEQRRRQRATDFINRYEQGAGISDEEAMQNYRAVAGRLSPEEYEQAAAQAFSRLPREERRALRRQMRQHRRGQGDLDDDDDPQTMARELSQERQQGSDPLGGLFGGLFGRRDEAPAPPSGQSQAQPQQGGGVDEILGSPVGKVVLGGIAAFALKQLMDKEGRL